eukprot:TRINITY_DN22886_c0_g1_i1.p1 TRINITY_DN22886_c0_g1~~TRINITY_DN22886_c0_g1_i1.p1  ORF type:complete len:615 (-),score=73.31 TRINITY_DN22886_c0_g1_i1:376-2220(-)
MSSSYNTGAMPREAQRYCGNPFCLLLFLATMGYLIWAHDYAVQHGSLLELTGLPNGQGVVCGVSGPVADMPFLYLCPDEEGVVRPSDLVCLSNCPVSAHTHVAKAACPSSPQPDYPTIPVAGKLCLPTNSMEYKKLAILSYQNGVESFLGIFYEICKAWALLLQTMIGAIGLSYVYLTMLNRNPSRIFWISTTLCTVVMGGMGITSVVSTIDMQIKLGYVWGVLENPEFIIGAIILACTACYHAVVLWDRGNIDAACQAIEAVAECAEDVPPLMIEPLLSAARKVILFVTFCIGLLSFISDFDRIQSSGPEGTTYTLHYEPKPILIAAGYVFGFMWLFEFSAAVSCFVYSYMAETWFYSSMDDESGMKSLDRSILVEAYWNVLRYSLGTLAYGSLMLMIFRPIRMIFDYTTRPVRKEHLSNPCYKCARRFWCWGDFCDRCTRAYEMLFRPIRKSAFMDVAMNGKEFWEAKDDADWALAGKNVAMSEMDGAANMIIMSGAFSIAALCAGMARLACEVWPDYSATSSDHYIMLPTLVSAVAFLICYMFSYQFLLMPELVSDSIFFCFCFQQKAYERQRGCNMQTLWGSSASPAMGLISASHPPKTMELYETFTSLQ